MAIENVSSPSDMPSRISKSVNNEQVIKPGKAAQTAKITPNPEIKPEASYSPSVSALENIETLKSTKAIVPFHDLTAAISHQVRQDESKATHKTQVNANIQEAARNQEAQNAQQRSENFQVRARLQAEITATEQAIINAKQELSQTGSQQIEAMFDSNNGQVKSSYWEQMDIAEKAYKINQLKEKIRNLELEQGDRVSVLRDQVLSGSYQVKGQEILQGMMAEFF